jgi:hypothetical protein
MILFSAKKFFPKLSKTTKINALLTRNSNIRNKGACSYLILAVWGLKNLFPGTKISKCRSRKSFKDLFIEEIFLYYLVPME